MIRDIRVIAIIPARGGSKSVIRKNLQQVGGISLVERAIEAAKSTSEIDRVIVSTDDEEIAQVVTELGVELYLRPSELASDSALVVDTIRSLRDILRNEGEDAEIFVLLEPTCPIRPEGLISNCLEKLVSTDSDSIATFQELPTKLERIWKIEKGIAAPYIEGSIPWKPRQELSTGYELNGAVYAFYPDKLPDNQPSLLYGKTQAFITKEHLIDIDTIEDLERINAFASKHAK